MAKRNPLGLGAHPESPFYGAQESWSMEPGRALERLTRKVAAAVKDLLEAQVLAEAAADRYDEAGDTERAAGLRKASRLIGGTIETLVGAEY